MLAEAQAHKWTVTLLNKFSAPNLGTTSTHSNNEIQDISFIGPDAESEIDQHQEAKFFMKRRQTSKTPELNSQNRVAIRGQD